MNRRAKKKSLENGEEQPYSFSDEATKDKIKRHLTDIRDVITERDIANVKIPGKENQVINPPGKETHVMPDVIASTNNKPVTPCDAQEE